MITDPTTHPFQRAGLGQAPFRFVRYEYLRRTAINDSTVVLPGVGGSCDYCATGIMHAFWIRSADGREFKVGSDCVFKTSPVSDRLSLEVAVEVRKIEREANRARREAQKAKRIEREKMKRAGEREQFLLENPAVAEALEAEHPILADMREKLARWGSLTPKQAEFALRLAAEVRNPKPAEVLVDAPEGKVEFVGTIVSSKYAETRFGSVLKITVKVETEAGSWLAWGTCPAEIRRADGAYRGTKVRVKANLKRGRDRHFALMSRPAGSIVEAAA